MRTVTFWPRYECQGCGLASLYELCQLAAGTVTAAHEPAAAAEGPRADTCPAGSGMDPALVGTLPGSCCARAHSDTSCRSRLRNRQGMDAAGCGQLYPGRTVVPRV